ncbi:hypothetical protein [Desulfobacula toluolica]|uniref:hypothetical protein n=1 Tax=Desulfobacula toluolica TaxID=28223 RepID=UPI0003077665|nr:hypothetical protein [Desulfobacula toluolica]
MMKQIKQVMIDFPIDHAQTVAAVLIAALYQQASFCPVLKLIQAPRTCLRTQSRSGYFIIGEFHDI